MQSHHEHGPGGQRKGAINWGRGGGEGEGSGCKQKQRKGRVVALFLCPRTRVAPVPPLGILLLSSLRWN